jgi:hypothetical protein
MVRTVYACGLWQSCSLLVLAASVWAASVWAASVWAASVWAAVRAALVSGAGLSSVPNTSCSRSAALSACSNPAAASVASRRVRQEEMNPVDTSTPSRADIRSAVRSIPSTSWLASRVAAAVTFGGV